MFKSIAKFFTNLFKKESIEPAIEKPTIEQPVIEKPIVLLPVNGMHTYASLEHNYAIMEPQLSEAQTKELKRALVKITSNFSRYKTVSDRTKFPWFAIAAIHYKEADLDFTCHLHNGDKPLSEPTRHVPKGRGGFPDWETSATDAILLEKFNLKTNEIGEVLDCLEKYNGLGFRKRGLNSVYLWSSTNICHPFGQYTSDGKFDSNAATNTRLGAALIIRELLKES